MNLQHNQPISIPEIDLDDSWALSQEVDIAYKAWLKRRGLPEINFFKQMARAPLNPKRRKVSYGPHTREQSQD